MKTTLNDISFKSSSGLCDIHAKCAAPVVTANAKAIFQITHGMAEHIERYDEFVSFLAENGYAVYLHDHLGHGKSVSSDDELGFFGENGGYKSLVEDCHELTKIAKSDFPGIPVIFFGHSMGSFVARAYVQRYGNELAAAIFCGTAGTNPAAGIAIKLADMIAKSKGSHFRSEFINTLAFGSYNKRIKPPRTDFDWLTKENDIVDKYVADKYCGFLFTAAGYRDMFTILNSVSKKSWYKTVSKSLPIMLIAGEDDPVGEYGKGVKQVCTDLKKAGHSDVTLKLYKNDRHEILNETDRADVMADIIAWADSKIG